MLRRLLEDGPPKVVGIGEALFPCVQPSMGTQQFDNEPIPAEAVSSDSISGSTIARCRRVPYGVRGDHRPFTAEKRATASQVKNGQRLE